MKMCHDFKGRVVSDQYYDDHGRWLRFADGTLAEIAENEYDGDRSRFYLSVVGSTVSGQHIESGVPYLEFNDLVLALGGSELEFAKNDV